MAKGHIWTRLRASVSRLRCVLSRQQIDDEVQSEIGEHLDLLAERYVSQGMSRGDAYIAARRQFGNATLARHDVRDLNSIGWLEQVLQDCRYALRQVRRSPGFASVVVATLGLGIGSATAVFSVVQAVLLAPLPYDEPGQLVRFYQQNPIRPESRDVVAGTHFKFLREHTTAFQGVAAAANYSATGLDLFADGAAKRLRILRVTSDYFRVLRSAPRLGREFNRSDEDDTKRVVLSDATWRTHFGANPAIVGSSIRLSGAQYEVVGVAQPDFEDPVVPEVAAWVAYALTRDTYEENNSLTGIGRLQNGVTLEQARAELATLAHSMRERWPAAEQYAIVATPLHDEVVARARGPLQLVFGAVALVLLVACVNVANLALVRATGRVQEFAVRAALGSGQSRLARQLLVESLVLASLGGATGLALAYAGTGLLEALGRQALPRLDDVSIRAEVLLFALAATVTTAVVFGVGPIVKLAGTPPLDALRQQSRSSTGSRRLARFRSGLAAAQVALAVALLAGAGVLLASFHQLRQVDVGVRVERVLTFELNLPSARYDEKRRASFQEELADRFQTIPGVTAAGGTSRLPATGNYHPWNIRIVTGPRAGSGVDRTRFAMQQRVISGDLFGALGIPLLAGRRFDERDAADAPGRVIVSANFARMAFPDVPLQAVIGQRLAAGREFEIIGVVGDVALDAYGAPTMIVYRPHRQFADNRNWTLVQVIATERNPRELLTDVRREVESLDPELVVHEPATMAEVVNRGSSRERFALVLMAAFALVALTLAALGLYGVLAYAVRQRSAEIGIRIALGATAKQVRALVLRQAGVVVGGGIVAGLAGALLLGRWLEALAFGVAPSDPRILTASAIVLAVVALIAAWLPAQRAARLEPRKAMVETL